MLFSNTVKGTLLRDTIKLLGVAAIGGGVVNPEQWDSITQLTSIVIGLIFGGSGLLASYKANSKDGG